MNVLVLGSGGREDAILWKLRQSTSVDELYICPGNGGSHRYAKVLSTSLGDRDELVSQIRSKAIDLVVIGPEQPLADGLVDHLRAVLPELAVLGPMKAAAQLEASKSFAKDFMKRHHIPTANSGTFTKSTIQEAEDFIEMQSAPVVLKADGLAAGKGVVIAQTHDEAIEVLHDMLNGRFGSASDVVLVEQYLAGREFSVFILCDGQDYKVLPTAKDYKRIGEGDQGQNTGGMGAISPVSFVDSLLWEKTLTKVVEPTLAGITSDGLDYRGILFIGMIEVHGEPFVIEYNCRLGDPETEAILPRIQSDLAIHLMEAANGSICTPVVISDRACAVVVMASGGYPGHYEKGQIITIDLGDMAQDDCKRIFHAGTMLSDNQLRTSGGRVLAVSCDGDTVQEALTSCYDTIERIHFDKQYYRTDIGFDL